MKATAALPRRLPRIFGLLPSRTTASAMSTTGHSPGFHAPTSAWRRWLLICRAHLIGEWLLVRAYLRWIFVIGVPAALVLGLVRPPIGLDTLGIIAAAIGIYLALYAATDGSYRLAPISVPEALAKSGWTGEIVAARISRACVATIHTLPSSKIGDVLPRGPAPPRVEIPGIKLAIDQVADLLRRSVGQSPNLINVEIVCSPGTVSDRDMQLHGYVYMASDDQSRPFGPYRLEEMHRLTEAVALQVLKYSAPHPASFALYLAKKYEMATQIAEDAGRDARLPRQMRAACCCLAALCHLHRDDLDGCLEDLRKAERIEGIAFSSAQPISEVLQALADFGDAETFGSAEKTIGAWYAQLARAVEAWHKQPLPPNAYAVAAASAAFQHRLHQRAAANVGRARQYLDKAEKIISDVEKLAENPSHRSLILTTKEGHAKWMLQFAEANIPRSGDNPGLEGERSVLLARMQALQERLEALNPAVEIAERTGRQEVAKIKRAAEDLKTQAQDAQAETSVQDKDQDDMPRT